MKEQILEDYKKNKRVYHAFRERITNLLTDLLLEQEIVVHQITGRTKAIDSLSKKIDDKGEKYSCIEDITDIVGVRIIAYMESDVDSVSELIEKEFVKDAANSIDKRKLKADQFGYRSLHIVVSLSDQRSKLKEYKRYKGLKCEIQVRSILQHAWAEIEHDLGYKGETAIPELYKRSFNRLSALLETADIEFDRLKIELKEYEEEVPRLIKAKPEFVDLNKASIKFILRTNSILKKAKDIIEERTGNRLVAGNLRDNYIDLLKYFDFKTIAQLEKYLEENSTSYINFVKLFVTERLSKGRQIISVAPLMYFLHFLAAKSQNLELMEAYFEKADFSNNGDTVAYLEIYKRSQQ